MSQPFNKNDIPLPLTLKEPSDEEEEKRKYSTFKLNSIVGDNNSPKIGIAVKHLTGTETLRNALIFLDDVKSLFRRLGLVNDNHGPSADAMVRELTSNSAMSTYIGITQSLIEDEFQTRLLDARRDGEAAGDTDAEMLARLAAVVPHLITLPYVIIAVQGIITFMSPFKVLARVKRYLRRGCRKPFDMKTRVYINNMMRINNQEIPNLPPGFNAGQSLSNDELLEIYHCSIPSSWSKEMQRQGFDPMEHTSDEFLEFCERLEAAEDFQPDKKSDNNNNKGGRSKKQPKIRDNRPHGKGDRSGEPNNCMLHGANTHPTSECFKLKKEAARLKEITNDYKKKNDNGSKNKTWSKSANDGKKKSSKEFNSIEKKKSTKFESSNSSKKRKSDSDSSDDDTVASLNNIDLKGFNYEDMDNLKIDDDDSDGEVFHDAKA